MRVKANDKILVIAGKYKGKTGKVMRVYKKTEKITVEGVNVRTKHIKKTSTHAGQKIKYEAPFSVSNAMVVCPNCEKATRVAYKIPKEGTKFRVCKKCGESLEQAVAKIEKKKKA
ncbi:50S ribosomal protein L24 [Candidatus Peregrinibacteria bacterium]|nr:50S ribosomal protein L24 [Candidatus Peregrinibacteria bacterium]